MPYMLLSRQRLEVKIMFETVKIRGSRIKDIKVPAHFKASPPNPEKLIRKTAEFINEGKLEKIYVDKDFNLMDGYCSYLIATTLGYKKAKIVQFRKRTKEAAETWATDR